MRKPITIIKSSCIAFSFILYLIIAFYNLKIPDKFYLTEGGQLTFENNYGVTAVFENAEAVAVSATSPAPAEETAQLKLFGISPIKEVKIERINRPSLIPCGTPFGIKMVTEGAIVTGFGNVDGVSRTYSPAKDAGLLCGDIIKTVNGRPIEKNSDIKTAVQANTDSTKIVYERNGITALTTLNPEKSKKDGLYKIGLWVRDSSAGIGTVTFYDPSTSTFAGLGHGICDVDTGKLMPLAKGEAISVNIGKVIKGMSGNPGELSGTFLSKVPIGIIEANTECGVFGSTDYPLSDHEPLPMAFKQEVKIGKASILTTINGNTPKEYQIIIEKIDFDENSKVKNMVIRITDPELLSNAGGIVQGMSGSPIIQDNSLVGAVTHVFVNDATRGYAIFAENMYRTAAMCKADNQSLAA